ncbi:MAG: TIGR03118 family protein, partial [Planctomycetes bacterium]|nr:TIGR03118 family protein [Planctomycetota bacterium]
MFRTHRRRPSVPHPIQLHIEALEDRCLLSGNVLQTNLVSDLPGVAQHLDPNLVNPWGISESSTSPFWLSDNNSGHSTLYDTTGTPQALVVSIPTPGDPAGNSGAPTGTVFNTTLASKTPGFTVSDGTHSGPAIFLFATEDGTILGWNPTVDPTGQFNGPNHASTHAVLAVDHSGNNFSEPDPLKQT